MENQALQRLCDERDINELLKRYCRAIDRCDFDLLRSVYWPDATEDHLGAVSSADEFIESNIQLIKQHIKRSMHFISNTTMRIEGDVALTETYVLGYHLLNRPGKVEMTLGARYLDRIERRGGEWRIAARKAVVDWEQNGPSLLGEDHVRELLATDKLYPADDSYKLFAGIPDRR